MPVVALSVSFFFKFLKCNSTGPTWPHNFWLLAAPLVYGYMSHQSFCSACVSCVARQWVSPSGCHPRQTVHGHGGSGGGFWSIIKLGVPINQVEQVAFPLSLHRHMGKGGESDRSALYLLRTRVPQGNQARLSHLDLHLSTASSLAARAKYQGISLASCFLCAFFKDCTEDGVNDISDEVTVCTGT